MKNSLATILRWIARIWGILSIAFILAMFIGEARSESTALQFQTYELVSLAFFPIGVLIGIVLGYWKEMAGGIIAICSLVAFYVAEFIGSGNLAGGPWFLLVTAPGLFFIAAALTSRDRIAV